MAHTRQYDLTTGTASQIRNLTKYSLFTLICEGILEQPDGTIEQPKRKGKRTNRDLACHAQGYLDVFFTLTSTALKLRRVEGQFDLLIPRSTVSMQHAVAKTFCFTNHITMFVGLGLVLTYQKIKRVRDPYSTITDRPFRKIIPLIRPPYSAPPGITLGFAASATGPGSACTRK
jgi:hypothetical protein